MHLERVYYQQNFQVGEFLFKTYGAGAFMNEGDNAEDAINACKEFVRQSYLKDTPHLFVDHSPDIPIISNEITGQAFDKEFEELKTALASYTYYEDAKEHLDRTDFRHAYEARLLIKDKPKRV